MAKRGRKPSEKKKNGYFYEKEEEAVLWYLSAETKEEKCQIYDTILKPAFEKMVESIIRRYKLYVPNEESGLTFNDAISFLFTKLDKFEPIVYTYKKVNNASSLNPSDIVEIDENEFFERIKDVTEDDENVIMVLSDNGEINGFYKKYKKAYKAYSYYGTICKNYLIGRILSYKKMLERNPSYDSVVDDFSNSLKYSDSADSGNDVASEVVSRLIRRIGEMINAENCNLKENEIALGKSLITLLENWEYVLTTDASYKLNKNAILLYLRESTGLDTKGIRDNMKKYKNEFSIIKSQVLS